MKRIERFIKKSAWGQAPAPNQTNLQMRQHIL